MNNTISSVSFNRAYNESIDNATILNNAKTTSTSETFSNILSRNIKNSNNNFPRNVPTGRPSFVLNDNNHQGTNNSYDNGTNLSDFDTIPEFNQNNIVNNSSFSSDFRVKIEAKDSATKERIAKAVSSASKEYGVDPNLILAVIKTESDFNPNIVSRAGAVGLMQIMPSNFKNLGVKNAYDIEDNIKGGTKLLRQYLDKYNGSIEMALMAYNGGPTRMANRGVKSIDDIYKMPKETQNYVPKVMKAYRGN